MKRRLRQRYGHGRTKHWPNGTHVRVKAPFEVGAWTGPPLGKNILPLVEKIDPSHFNF